MISFELVAYNTFPVEKVNILDNEEVIGEYWLIPHSEEILEVHTLLKKSAYGSAVEISKSFLKWLFTTNNKIEVLITKVPVSNSLARRLTKKCNFIQYGILPKSFKHNNELEDQEMYYITKEIVSCLFQHQL